MLLKMINLLALQKKTKYERCIVFIVSIIVGVTTYLQKKGLTVHTMQCSRKICKHVKDVGRSQTVCIQENVNGVYKLIKQDCR